MSDGFQFDESSADFDAYTKLNCDNRQPDPGYPLRMETSVRSVYKASIDLPKRFRISPTKKHIKRITRINISHFKVLLY